MGPVVGSRRANFGAGRLLAALERGVLCVVQVLFAQLVAISTSFAPAAGPAARTTPYRRRWTLNMLLGGRVAHANAGLYGCQRPVRRAERPSVRGTSEGTSSEAPPQTDELDRRIFATRNLLHLSRLRP